MFRFGIKNLGIDLGTANTNVYVEGNGIVLREPSVVAKTVGTNKILAIGKEARNMIGRTPQSIVTIRPMKNGVIADYDTTSEMMRYFINKTNSSRIFKPYVVVCVPSGVTGVEKKAVIDATLMSGAKDVFIIEEPFAAAIGAGLPVMKSAGNMVIDIGGGTTDVATISLGGIVSSKTIHAAGDRMDEAIIHYLRKSHNLLIGDRTAEQIKVNSASASIEKAAEYSSVEIRGRNQLTGLPQTITVPAQDIALAIQEAIGEIVFAVHETLGKTPPEISADIIDHGIVLTGGGALLKDLSHVLTNEIGVPVFVASNPLDCVAIGTGKTLHDIHFYLKQVKKGL